MGHQKFLREYRKLNAEQKRAVDSIEGPVMVIAGPGTGKTTVLTLRIANILRNTDTPPDSILALTFTESGVFSMRKNLVNIIGSAGYRVAIHTFHGFCNEIITRYPDEFPRIIGANPINEVERISLLKEIIISSPIKKLKPFGDAFYYVIPLCQKISELKRENIPPKRLRALLAEQKKKFLEIPDLYYKEGRYTGRMKGVYHTYAKKIEKNKELLLVYSLYEKELQKKRFYDYEDMVVEAIGTLEKNKHLLLCLQEEYHYILADEHQDANNSQNRLLELLAGFHDNPNLFIVGDEKQAIFRFQGASLENFLHFEKQYPGALRIALSHNYRSTQTILDSSHSMMANQEVASTSLCVKLKSSRGSGAPVELRSFSKPEHELLFLVKDVEKKIKDGITPSEIAVLYRNNRDADSLVQVFEQTTVPFVVESSQNVLSDNDLRKFITIIRAINEYGDDVLLLAMLHIDFLGLSPLDIYRMSSYAHKKQISIYSLVESDAHLRATGISQPKQIKGLHSRFSSWKSVSKNRGILEFLDVVLRESGFLAHILKSEIAHEKMGKLTALLDEVKTLVQNYRGYTLEELINYFETLEMHNLSIERRLRNVLPEGVRLMTAHRSKGLEFDFVYIVGVYDGHWGSRRSRDHFLIPLAKTEPIMSHDDDERRLLYVALTRARHAIFLSYAKEGQGGKLRLPSRFVEEINKRYIKEKTTSLFEKSICSDELFKPKRTPSTNITQREFLKDLFCEQGLSVTALNNYLECPWNYFYNNLLRVPRVPSKHMMFGTAVHKTLKHFFDAWGGGVNLKKRGLLMLFEEYLKKQPFSEREFAEAYKKGTVALCGYHDVYRKGWTRMTYNEFKVTVLLHTNIPEMPRLRLRGDLDKIEILNDRGGVSVVDYKTGKPKSRNAIEGNIKTSTGDYKRQLVFYKLLLNLYDSGRFTMLSGVLDFIEPDNRGRYHKERFIITDNDTDELRDTLMGVSEEILHMRFWDKGCKKERCPYCKMRGMMEL